MKKIIVTGGSGFIGSNLVNYLVKKKYKNPKPIIKVIGAVKGK